MISEPTGSDKIRWSWKAVWCHANAF